MGLESLDDIFDIAVHSGGDVATVVVDTVIGNAVLREVVGADFFAAVPCSDERFAGIGGVGAVLGNLALEEAATEKDLPPAYEVKTDEKLPASVEWIWEAYVDLSDPETFVVSFRAPVKDKMDFSVLRYLKTKEVVDLDQYEILWKGDSLELSFSKDFLKKFILKK